MSIIVMFNTTANIRIQHVSHVKFEHNTLYVTHGNIGKLEETVFYNVTEFNIQK